MPHILPAPRQAPTCGAVHSGRGDAQCVPLPRGSVRRDGRTMTRPVSSSPPSVKEWRLNLYLSEHDPDTTARIVLDTGDNILESRAEARRSPLDQAVPEIGDELAAGRALIAMGHVLLS